MQENAAAAGGGIGGVSGEIQLGAEAEEGA